MELNGQIEAALALTAVESLCNMKQLMKFLPNLKRTGESISKAFGYGTGKNSPATAHSPEYSLTYTFNILKTLLLTR